jgi:CHAT domain
MDEIEVAVKDVCVKLREARELRKTGAVSTAIFAYENAISNALYIDIYRESGLLEKVEKDKYILDEISRAFSRKSIDIIESPSELLLAETCHETIEHLITHNLNFEALAIIEILKSRRLSKKLSQQKYNRLGYRADVIFNTELDPNVVKEIFRYENDSCAILYFYVSPNNNKTYAFLIHGTELDIICDLELIIKDEENTRFFDNVKLYICALQQNELHNANKYLCDLTIFLGRRLTSLLSKAPMHTVRKLIISPHAILHHIPIHAVSIDDQGKNGNIISMYNNVVFTPSIQLYWEAIANKDAELWDSSIIGSFDIENLTYSPAGLAAFNYFFSDLDINIVVNPLRAKIDRILGKTLVHFDCHGMSNQQDFLNSYIEMHDGTLSFREIIETCNLKSTWLVVLNACYTGLSLNPGIWLDEYYGIDGAFLSQGALSVVSTLSPVLDIAAYLVIQRMYIGICAGLDISMALQLAQVWLRDGEWKTDPTVKAMTTYIGRFANATSGYLSKKLWDCKIKLTEFLRDAPYDYFSEPVYWAQWKCSGSGESFGRIIEQRLLTD